MKDVEMLGRKGIEMLQKIGIITKPIKHFGVTRRKTVLGYCETYNRGNYCKIYINKCLLEDNVTEKEFFNTMLHELLHSVPECDCHTGKWKRLAEKVNRELGYNISRAEDGTNISEEVMINLTKDKKTFSVQCMECGMVHSAKGYRSPKWYAHCENFRCARCSGELIRMINFSDY